jgi:hypothetical protein
MRCAIPFSNAAQTDETDLHFSIPLKMGHGDRPDVLDVASQPGVYRFRVR